VARKTVFDRKDVLEAAYAVLETDGLAAVTARAVAERLGASTAPVYSNFASMDELVAAVMRRAADEVLASCRLRRTDDTFLDMGVGFVHFASDHPQLYRALYLDSTWGAQMDEVIFAALEQDLGAHPILGELPADHRAELLFQAGIYTMGIATSLVAGTWREPDLQLAESWLRSVGGVLVRAALDSAGIAVPAELERSFGEFIAPWRRPGCPGAKEGPHD
jgi:AcrR family transcriptional regulator